jgi:hypothetical protein
MMDGKWYCTYAVMPLQQWSQEEWGICSARVWLSGKETWIRWISEEIMP